MSFLADLKARKKKGPGSVEITFEGDDKPIVVPLKYPNAVAQAEVMAFIGNIDTAATLTQSLETNVALSALMVRHCLDTDEEIDDEDLTILINESGGHEGTLAKRCAQLMGFNFGESDNSKVVGRKRRGR